MPAAAHDPYATLGVTPTVTDAELRSAYRRLVLKHHPDHNGGSAESTRRFEEIQDAYARVRDLRAGRTTAGRATRNGARAPGSSAGGGSPPRGSGAVEDRLREMERELREARQAREAELREAARRREEAARAAREAAAAASAEFGPGGTGGAGSHDDLRRRARDEELGYYSTDDSFSKILADARADITEIFGRAITAAERAAEEAARRAANRRDNDD